jgi:riboflavin kinase/FMN adenylyltransferase
LDEIAISSTKIREALLEGKIEIADKLLGYEFFFSGIVVDGDKLGRKLGYPTANLKINNEEKIIPGNGIYAVYAEVSGDASTGFQGLFPYHVRSKTERNDEHWLSPNGGWEKAGNRSQPI